MKELSWLVPITDLRAQYNTIRKEVDDVIQKVVREGKFILGPEVTALETEIAAYFGVKYAIGVASGTDALRLALLACGIGPGDEVITTPFTFVAPVETIIHCGATPVFVDINPFTYNIDAAKIEEKITSNTRAILPVYLFGQPADMDPIIQLAKEYNLMIIEDCAQALGAEYKGKKAGSLGNVGCLSFFPSKNLGAYGDGGMVVTDDQKIADAVDMLRKHGTLNNHHILPGFNSRLDTLQAAVLLVKLKYLDAWIDIRREKAALYNRLLCDIDGIVPAYAENYVNHSYNYYTARITDQVVTRDSLKRHLESSGIQTKVYYALSLHLQEAFRYLGYAKGDFPVSEQVQAQVISLPLYPEMSDDQIGMVVDVMRIYIGSQQFESISHL